MVNIGVLICNVILTGCVVYDCFAVRKMFKEYKDVLYKNQVQNNYITEKEQEIDKLIKENNMLKELYNQVVEENGKSDKPVEEKKKRGPKSEKITEKLEKVLKMLKKDDNLTVINAFAKAGLNTASTSRTLRMHGKYEEWLKIQEQRRRKPYDMINKIVENKKCTIKEACEEVGFSYARYFQLRAQYENI